MLQPRREHSGMRRAFLGSLEVTWKVSHQRRALREGLSSPYCKCGTRGTERGSDLAQAPLRGRRFQAQFSLVQSFPLHRMPREDTGREWGKHSGLQLPLLDAEDPAVLGAQRRWRPTPRLSISHQAHCDLPACRLALLSIRISWETSIMKT